MAVKQFTRGFTLVELMVAMTLTVLLIIGVSGVYLTLKQTSNQVNQLENAQEVLRSAHQFLYRSTLQAQSVSSTQFTVTFEQAANTVACDGSQPSVNFTERYHQQGNNLICTLNQGSESDIVLLTHLSAIAFSLNTDPVIGPTRLTVLLAPNGLPENFPNVPVNGQNLPGIQLEFALKALILQWAT